MAEPQRSGEAPPNLPRLNNFADPNAGTSGDNPLGFTAFMRSGDLPTPGGSPPADPPRDTPPTVAVPPAHPQSANINRAPVLPGASPITPTGPAVTSPQPQPQPPTLAVQPPSQTQNNPSSFFSGLFRKASATLESTIETVSQNETFASAQETLVGIAASVTSPNPLPDIEVARTTTSTSNGDAPGTATNSSSQFAQGSTVAMRALRVNGSMGAAPLNMFVNEESRDIFVVTEHAIEAFAMDGSKLLQANVTEQLQQYQMGLQQQEDNNNNNNNDTTINIGSPHLNRRRNRIHSRPADGAIAAISSTYIPESEEVVIAHADASIHVYSVRSGQMGVRLRGTLPLASQAACLSKTTLQDGVKNISIPRRILVGSKNGLSSLIKVDELTDIAWLHPPEMCETPLGAGSTSAPVACILPLDSTPQDTSPSSTTSPLSPANASVVVGYGDGTLCGGKFEDPLESTPFAAHGGAIGGIVMFFDGEVVVSIGDEEDRSVAAFLLNSGRCLVRRILPYVPTSICRIAAPHIEGKRDQWICSSESVFLVGGDEGQIDLFRLVALSHQRLELRLIRRISERTRGKKRTVLQTHYCAKEAILLALSLNGEIRRWHLNEEEARTLVSSEERMKEGPYDSAKASKVIKNLGAEDGINTRLAVGEGVITAQRVLASIQDDQVGLDEEGKDRVVEEFQKKQAEMQEVAEQADGELRRAKLRIARRFSKINDSVETQGKMLTAAKRMAAFELNFEALKHNDTLCKVRGDTVKKLSAVIIQALESARGDAAKIEEIKEAAKNLLNIPVNS